MNIGIIGCGNISNAYFKGAKTFSRLMTVTACADLNPEAARAKAEEYGVRALSVDALLADPDIELVINLTIPLAHTEVNLAILEAGKHAYCEKPLGVNLAEARRQLDAAARNGKRLGCAPDTFLGAAHQACRKAIDDGLIGRPLSGTAFMMCAGHESWHPNPQFYYQQGGGPMLDMGPYYITDLVQLLGPVARVCGHTSQAFDERVCTSAARMGDVLTVDVPTHYAGLLEFVSGAVVTVTMSFDVKKHGLPPIQLHGTAGSLSVSDPNAFGNKPELFRPETGEWRELAFLHPYKENFRSIGAADMADAIRDGRPHRCSAELAFHVLEVMTAFERSSDADEWIKMESTCNRPAMLPTGIRLGALD